MGVEAGGAKASYYTGWLNLIGLLAIVASRLSARRVPVAGVILTAVIGIIHLTRPDHGRHQWRGRPVAFFAVVSIGVIGLYWCFSIPIWHRWRRGSSFVPGGWTLGNKYNVLSVIALIDIVLVTFMAFMPTSNLGVPWNTGFAWKYVNYTILWCRPP